jgi:hypothetical protein
MNLHDDQKGAASRKSVHFAKTCEMYLIPCLEDYTEEEICSIWMPEQDYQLIREDCFAVVSKLNSGVPEDENLCYRGLEWKAKAKAVGRYRKRSRTRAAGAVFGEQNQQWDDGVTHPEKIRAAYKILTERSRHEAFVRAIRDSEASLEACLESREPKREQDLGKKKPANEKKNSPCPRRSLASSIAALYPEVNNSRGGGAAKSA